MWCSVQFGNRICSGALYVLGIGCWRFDKCSHRISVKFGASMCFLFANWGTFVIFYYFQVQVVMFDVSPGLAMCRHKQKWVLGEDKHTLSSHSVLFLYRVNNQAQLNLETASGADNCWSRHLTTLMTSSNEDTLSLVPCGFLISFNCLEHFLVDPAIVPIKATWHQLVTLCRSICVEERAKSLDQLMGSKYFTAYFIALVAFLSSFYLSCFQS